MIDKLDIDVRPVPVDKMAIFKDEELSSREARVAELLTAYTGYVDSLREELEETERNKDFLERESKHVKLAMLLKRGDLVRVICPSCKGSGMKPTDVTTGRVSNIAAGSGSAFESVGNKSTRPEDDPHLQCPECKGMQWVIMERYRG